MVSACSLQVRKVTQKLFFIMDANSISWKCHKSITEASQKYHESILMDFIHVFAHLVMLATVAISSCSVHQLSLFLFSDTYSGSCPRASDFGLNVNNWWTLTLTNIHCRPSRANKFDLKRKKNEKKQQQQNEKQKRTCTSWCAYGFA
jgi:hypothetical protein